MLGLIALLGLVLALVKLTSNPESWRWFVILSEGKSSEPAADSSTPELKPLNIRRERSEGPLPDDTYYARVENEPGEAREAATDAPSEPAPDEAEIEASEGEPPATAPSDVARLPEGMLQGMEDDWHGLTRAEQPALLRVAERLEDISLQQLRSAADSQATFPVMLGNPEYYRGRAVAFTGRVKRLTPGALHSDGTTRKVWEAYVITEDSQQTPMLVFLNQPPAGMPQGEKIDQKATVAGYVLRRYAYAAVGGEEVSLMLFAPTLQWHPPVPPAGERVTKDLRISTLIVAGVLAAGLLALIVWFARSDRRYRNSRMHEIAESRLDAAPQELAALASLDSGDPHRLPVEELSALDRRQP
jgi:hypothetical protein